MMTLQNLALVAVLTMFAVAAAAALGWMSLRIALLLIEPATARRVPDRTPLGKRAAMNRKASTAALRPILQSRPSFGKGSPCHPASGRLQPRAGLRAPRPFLWVVGSRPQFAESFYSLTDGYFGRGGSPR